MESDSTSSFPSKQDQDHLPIICPDFSIWDVGIDHIFNEKGKELQEKSQEINEGGSSVNQDEVEKKIVHREIEKQRRKDMATLYASLRSVLPSHYIKGKRSISDQIHAATKYITCLQNNNRQLEIKRENIKGCCKNELPESEKGSSSKNLPIVVTVQPNSIGIEVLIKAEGLTLPLSRIVQLLLDEGLNVVDCNCTELDGRVHYMIQSEVLTYPSVNLQMLQSKLISMICALTDIKQ